MAAVFDVCGEEEDVGTDIVARTVIAPDVLPVGVTTGLIGIPLFIFLLVRMSRE